MLGVRLEGGDGNLALVAVPLSTREELPRFKTHPSRRIHLSVSQLAYTSIISFRTQPFLLM